METPDSRESSTLSGLSGVKRLKEQRIRQIDMALESVGEHGEIDLIARHGQLKYTNRVESHRAWDSYDDGKASSTP